MSLMIKNLSVLLAGKKILDRINLEIKPASLHAMMGPNGSGKTTLARAVMGDTNCQITNSSSLWLDDLDLTRCKVDQRAKKGLFLAFQSPVAIAGVSVIDLIRAVYHDSILPAWEKNKKLVSLFKELNLAQEFLHRSLNEDFSGGEKKKFEMIQALLFSPKYAIFDEIDTGLDVDSLQAVAKGILKLKKRGCGILLITHYQRILKLVKPDYVHILVKGKIVESGDYQLTKLVEKNGYKQWI